ncbi:uncharacterized protein IL334_003640 [Kwoniella shivajii]|uniref:SUN domain-containing protein n=1 Tax=Kwoniella shivajii TaxID=564305 RepID=A0ABZ1CZU2_9TREE|nr:hypothetical protein IL334_003640 [Kwoniella shivajii]
MPGRASTVTSLYSDDQTEVPPLTSPISKDNFDYDRYDNQQNQYGGEGGVKEGRLIDYDLPTPIANPKGKDKDSKMDLAPGDKLRELLNIMKKEIESTKTPIHISDQVGSGTSQRPNNQDHMSSRESSPDRKNRDSGIAYEEEEEEEEEESPPTPPPRIGNPYAARRGERRESPNLSQPGRLPSRAAVLLNSTSRSPPSPVLEAEAKSPPTRLEAFLASTSSMPPTQYAESSSAARYHNPLSHSQSRRDSVSSTSSSRKGKDRAFSPIQVTTQEQEYTSANPRRNRFRQTTPTPIETSSSAENMRGHTPITPRRLSVDLAPDDISSFARNAVDLEVRGEVELDLDEGLSGLGWDETSESILEDKVVPTEPSPRHGKHRIRSVSRSPERRERSVTAKPRSPSPPRNPRHPQSRLSPISNPSTRRTPPLSRSIPPTKRSSPSPPLPALPEPDLSASENSEIDTYSSRRAALFRSTSRSAPTSASTSRNTTKNSSGSYGTATAYRSRLSPRDTVEGNEDSPLVAGSRILPRRSPQSRSSPNRSTSPEPANPGSVTPGKPYQSPTQPSPPTRPYSSTKPSHEQSTGKVETNLRSPRNVEDMIIPAQQPIRVGISLTSTSNSISTPTKLQNPNMSTIPTPKPPGAWQSTPRNKVRFNPSPLSRSPIKPDTPSQEGVSVHRLRVSPRRSPKAKDNDKEKSKDDIGDSSFLGRLAGSISSPLKRSKLAIPIPPRSTTFTLHSSSLEKARSITLAAEQNLMMSQKQWLEALAAINAATASGSVGDVVKKGWGWSTWLLWALVEVLVIWSVFRVTIDYATSLNHLSTLDPFHPLSLPFRQSTSSSFTTWGHGPFGLSNPINLNIPIPSALQSLVGHGRNANFFDLVESWSIWKISHQGVVEGRLVAGVPS